MRKSISKKEFYFSVIPNGFMCLTHIYYIVLIFQDPKYLTKMTHLNMHANCIYLWLCVLADICFYCYNSKKLEKVGCFARNNMSPVCNTTSLFVMIFYWPAYWLGYMPQFIGSFKTLLSIYHHFLINIIIFLELFMANHRRHRFTIKYMLIILLVFLLYGVIFIISTYVADIPPYPALKKLKPGYVVLMIVGMLILLFGCYWLYILFSYIKYRFIVKSLDKDSYNCEEDVDGELNEENEQRLCRPTQYTEDEENIKDKDVENNEGDEKV